MKIALAIANTCLAILPAYLFIKILVEMRHYDLVILRLPFETFETKFVIFSLVTGLTLIILSVIASWIIANKNKERQSWLVIVMLIVGIPAYLFFGYAFQNIRGVVVIDDSRSIIPPTRTTP